jgi:hypothetical protein
MPSLDLILNQFKPLHTLASYLFMLHVNIILQSTFRSLKSLLSSGFQPKILYVVLYKYKNRVLY